MDLKKRILENVNKTIKEKKGLETLTLRQLLAAILNKEKEKRFKITKEKPDISEKELEKESRLTDEEVIEVISSEIKKRKEAISEYKKGKREDLAEKEKRELEILQKYLPEQLSEEEIKKIAEEAIEKVEAKEPKEIGKVMAELMPQVKGKAEGATVSKIVKELLQKKSDDRNQ
jgi:uncharacterized protein YqeY